MELARREFLKRSAEAALLLGLAGSGLSCATTSGSPKTGAESGSQKTRAERTLYKILQPENYAKLTKNWDSIFGPPLRQDVIWDRNRLNIPADYEGHKQVGSPGPGVDYDVPNGTPLVPALPGWIVGITRDRYGGLMTGIESLYNLVYIVEYVHIDDTIVGENFVFRTGSLRSGKPLRIMGMGEIIALSGNTGWHYSGFNPPHLHFNLIKYGKNKEMEFLDAEKYGLDGGKPVFWDGESIICTSPKRKLSRLEQKLQGLKQELQSWPGEQSELKGKIQEYHDKMGDVKGNAILDDKNFQEIRALLKTEVLQGKNHVPGSKPYSLMYALLGFSMIPPHVNQPVTVSSQFIAPQLVNKYRVPQYNNGMFVRYENGQIVPVTK